MPSFPVPPLPDTPIRNDPNPTPPTTGILAEIQGNILKSHGRDFGRVVFFKFGSDDAKNRQLLIDSRNKNPWGQVLTAAQQADQRQRFYLAGEQQLALAQNKSAQNPAPSGVDYVQLAKREVFATLMLSRAGLTKLDCKLDDFGQPLAAFEKGMCLQMRHGEKNGRASITSDWAYPYTQENAFDGIVLLAGDDESSLDTAVSNFVTWCAGYDAKVLENETEKTFTWRFPETTDDRGRRKKGAPREPFGFADGISRPLFFQSDRKGIDPAAAVPPWKWTDLKLEHVLIGEQQSRKYYCGSFMTLLKLEQDVQAFRDYEAEVAKALVKQTSISVVDAEKLAPALLTGRARNGDSFATILRQLEPESTEKLFGPAMSGGPFPHRLNRFEFKEGSTDARCPFHAHIRKINPRVDHAGEFGKDRIIKTQLARRGMLFGSTQEKLDRCECGKDPLPTTRSGVGLLFMAYMSDIATQFEVLHTSWAADEEFPDADGDGQRDPVLFAGNGNPWTFQLGKVKVQFPPFPAKSFVRRLGGAYFFVPSIAFLERGGRPNP